MPQPRARQTAKEPLKFAGKMEANLGEVGLGHLEDVVAVCQEDVTSLFVSGHVLAFALFEGFERRRIVAFYPASFVETDGLPAALRAVFVKQAVLYHLELELPHGADDFASVEGVGEHLGDAFVHQLGYAFFELLRLHRVGVLDVLEHFRGE